MHVVLTQKKEFRKLRNVSKKKISGFFSICKQNTNTYYYKKQTKRQYVGWHYTLISDYKKENKQAAAFFREINIFSRKKHALKN